MLKYWPFKQSYLLMLVCVILVFAGYRFAVKHTYDALLANKQLKSQLAPQNNVAEQPEYLERKNSNLNKIIELYRADTLTYRSDAISSISIIANKYNVRLINAPVQDKTYHTDKYFLQKLSFTGDYFSIIKLMRQLEATQGIGVMRSWAIKGPRTKTISEGQITVETIFEVATK